MPAQAELYQAVFQRMRAITRRVPWRRSAVTRLALLVTGIIGARSCVLAQVAEELGRLRVTRARRPASIERRLRRTLADARLSAEEGYQPALRGAIDWFSLLWHRRWLVLIIDETSQDERLHLLRASLAYRGGSLPLAWELWPQNRAQEEGAYWRAIDRVLGQVAALVPYGLEVVVVADRAYDIPPFLDRVAAYGWHWLVRAKGDSDLRVRDQRGRETKLKALLARHVAHPGQRWKGQVEAFKLAGWRAASLVAVWAVGQRDPLVTLGDLPASWALHALYDARFWTEPGFRADKTHGWRWEDSQVRDLAHQRVLLVALAWASLLALCLGQAAAQAERAAQVRRARQRRRAGKAPARPQHARASLFTMGCQLARRWLAGAVSPCLTWCLEEVSAHSWSAEWFQAQAHLFIFQTVRP